MEENSPTRSRLPRIIPVMDIRGGVVVRAIAGRREEYKPLVSRLANSTEPLEVAAALRRVAGTGELYVADLDAIGGARPNVDLFWRLAQRNSLWVDAGVRSEHDVDWLFSGSVSVVVAGLESLDGPDAVRRITEEFLPRALVFSLDLRHAVPVAASDRWPASPDAIIDDWWALGVKRILILDLSDVGTFGGVGSLELLQRTKSKYPRLEVIAGGGVRGPEDLPALANAGVDAVLVASALHDGKFGLPGAAL